MASISLRANAEAVEKLAAGPGRGAAAKAGLRTASRARHGSMRFMGLHRDKGPWARDVECGNSLPLLFLLPGQQAWQAARPRGDVPVAKNKSGNELPHSTKGRPPLPAALRDYPRNARK